MASTTALLKTYVCPNCQFKPDSTYDPDSQEWLDAVFPEPRYADLPLGDCPACYAGENPQRQKMTSHLEPVSGIDLSHLLNQKTVASDAILEATQVPDLDENGQQIMVESGSHFEQQFDPQTGETNVVPVTDYSPKMRDLTDKELAALKLQRDQNLDALSAIAVSETTEAT